jgi:hypothetical protein
MPGIYGPVDLVKNELRNAIIQNLGTAPAAPLKGQIYFDSSVNILYWYNGSAWIPAQSGGSLTPASTVTTQAVGDAPVVGASSNYAREDHKHGREAFGAVTAETSFGLAPSSGVAATVARSDHAHGNPTHVAATHSTFPLDTFAVPAGPLNLGNQRITNQADPTGAQDGATKNYVDNSVTGMQWKNPVNVATTGNITLSGTQTIDGVATFANWRVLVKNQTDATTNGIYTVQSTAWTRATDNDAVGEILSASVWVESGTTQADTAWVCTNDAPFTLGTTAMTWVQFAGSGSVVAGAGMTQAGSTLNVIAGDTSLTVNADELHVNTAIIATVASLASYAPTSRLLNTTAPLTGGGNLTADRTLAISNFAGSVPGAVPTSPGGTATFLRADGTWSSPPGTGIAKFAATLAGTASPEVVTHNLNTRDVAVEVLNGSTPYTSVLVDWDATTVNTITIRYNPTLGAGYRVVVVG